MCKFDIDHFYLVISDKNFRKLLQYNQELSLFRHSKTDVGHDSWEGLYTRFTNGFYIEILTPSSDRKAGDTGLAFSSFNKPNDLNLQDLDKYECNQIIRDDKTKWFDAFWLKEWKKKNLEIWGMKYHPPLPKKKKKSDLDIGIIFEMKVYLKEKTFNQLLDTSDIEFPYRKRRGEDSLTIYSFNSDMKIKFIRSNKNRIVIKFLDNKLRERISKKEICYKQHKYSELTING